MWSGVWRLLCMGYDFSLLISGSRFHVSGGPGEIPCKTTGYGDDMSWVEWGSRWMCARGVPLSNHVPILP